MSWIKDSSVRFYDVIGWIKILGGIDARYPNLAQAVRWPDDPTRQIHGISIAKWGLSMKFGCDQLAGNTEPKLNDLDDGLLCNSHFGSMQFFHAQASVPGEPAVETYDKIFSWAEFLFRVASGQLDDEALDQAYCGYFSGNDVFHRAMRSASSNVACGEAGGEAWELSTFFNMECSNAFSSKSCSEEVGQSKFDKARIYATGALLHLIQDSYSQSHCVRGRCEYELPDSIVVAKVECLPVTMFTTYRGQVRHAHADRTPRFSASCVSNRDSIDDPITASAKMLWHIHHRSPIHKFRADLARVFGTREQILEHGQPAGLGACFGGREDG